MAPKSKAEKASVKPGKLPSGGARDAQAAKDKALTVQVLAKRNADLKYAEIASDLGITVGKAIFLYECANVAPKDKIKVDENVGAKIVAVRAQGVSWGLIAARSGLPEGKVKKIWSDTTNKPWLGETIGKGGRKANGAAPVKATKAVKAKPVKAAAKPAPAASEDKPAAKPVVRRTVRRRVAAS